MADDKADRLGVALELMQYGVAIAKAILEDYAEVIAKLEGVTSEDVRKRVLDRVNNILTEHKASIKAPEPKSGMSISRLNFCRRQRPMLLNEEERPAD